MVSKCLSARSISSASASLHVPMRWSSDEPTLSCSLSFLQSRPPAQKLDGGPVERCTVTVGEAPNRPGQFVSKASNGELFHVLSFV